MEKGKVIKIIEIKTYVLWIFIPIKVSIIFTCHTPIVIYASLSSNPVYFITVDNFRNNVRNKSAELIFIKIPNCLCLPLFILKKILLMNPFINLQQLLLRTNCPQLNYIIQIWNPISSLSHPPTPYNLW